MDGSFEEDNMSAEQYAQFKRDKLKAFKERQRKYSYDELEQLFKSYGEFATNYATAYYDREITLPDPKAWLALNK